MLDLAEEITGKRALPGFSPAVLRDEDVSCYLRPLHDLVMNGSLEFGKEESLRIGRAKKLLEQGASPMEAALQTGFSDQSHFTNYFTRFIGLTPGAYRDIFLKNDGAGGGGQDSP